MSLTVTNDLAIVICITNKKYFCAHFGILQEKFPKCGPKYVLFCIQMTSAKSLVTVYDITHVFPVIKPLGAIYILRNTLHGLTF